MRIHDATLLCKGLNRLSDITMLLYRLPGFIPLRMTSAKPPCKTVPFAYPKAGQEFFQAILSKLLKEVSRLREEYIPEGNVHVFHHGRSWDSPLEKETGFERQTGEFQLHSQKVTFSTDKVLNQELDAITEFVNSMASQINEEFVMSLYVMINQVCEENDRTLEHTKGTSIADATLEALGSIQCGVDRDGNVSMPQMHLSPEMIEKFGMSFLLRGPELKRKFGELRERLTKEALEREEKRKARFRKE